jgi:hypothetical protein
MKNPLWRWERIAPLDLPWIDGLAPVAINERFRFYRYTKGQYFAPHYDGFYCRPDGSQRS